MKTKDEPDHIKIHRIQAVTAMEVFVNTLDRKDKYVEQLQKSHHKFILAYVKYLKYHNKLK